MKQDLEILARLGEIREGAKHKGAKHVPNVSFAPAGAGRLDGDLNNVAHISRPDLIKELLARQAVDEDRAAVGPQPVLVEAAAVELYTLHVWLMSELARELLRLLEPSWDEEEGERATLAMQFWLSTADRLVAEGIFVDSSES